MTDIPEGALQAAVEALGAHPWNSYPHAAHREHTFDSACMVCRADLEPIARVILEAAVDALAGAGLVVVSAGEHENLREAARIVTENRWYERLAQAEALRERVEKAEHVIARAENLRDKWLAWPTDDMHYAAGLMLAKYLSDEPPALDDTEESAGG